ncbi:hypothetical protein [Paludisphaera rhizosphaerae]|uniref:hypothetical protein n=1 Tax=Paludisphaera rhizosphaerae TaxID=2711216 RepID=UPI0013ED30FE|nr:hypothetical protein [Paludisphaera rhizosphaerae]
MRRRSVRFAPAWAIDPLEIRLTPSALFSVAAMESVTAVATVDETIAVSYGDDDPDVPDPDPTDPSYPTPPPEEDPGPFPGSPPPPVFPEPPIGGPIGPG